MTVPFLAAGLDTPHGFFTREGGISSGRFATLNCSLSGRDDPGAVAENRARAKAALGVARMVGLYQVHGCRVQVVEEPWGDDARPQGDALVTRRPGVALGIVTADCAPVLFADAEAGVVGAAHAGWRGAVAGVLEATVDAMERLGAERGRIGQGGGDGATVQVVVYAGKGQRVGLIVGRILDIVEETIASRSRSGRAGVLFTAVIQGRVTEFLDIEGIIRSADPEFFEQQPVPAEV